MNECEACNGTGFIIPDEPDIKSVIIDGDGDAWMRYSSGWSSTASGTDFHDETWEYILTEFGLGRILYAA
jgi:hypothetical protein